MTITSPKALRNASQEKDDVSRCLVPVWSRGSGGDLNPQEKAPSLEIRFETWTIIVGVRHLKLIWTSFSASIHVASRGMFGLLVRLIHSPNTGHTKK